MNTLFRLRKDMPLAGLVPFKHILYMALLSDVTILEEDDSRMAIFAKEQSDLYDYFSDWANEDDRRDEVLKALNELSEDGLIYFDDEDRIFLGEFRGRKFFPFEVKTSMFETASKLLDDAIKTYGASKSAKDKSRSRYIREQVDKLFSTGIESLSPSDFTDLHGYVYELYTGGEIYTIRNKVEYYQTNNMLKHYDRFTVFALIVEGTLNFDKYRSKGVPTLTTVACMADDVFRGLTKSDAGSKDYMREMTSTTTEESDF